MGSNDVLVVSSTQLNGKWSLVLIQCLLTSSGFYEDNSEAEIEWIPTKGDGHTKPYFDNLDETFLDEEDSYQVRCIL